MAGLPGMIADIVLNEVEELKKIKQYCDCT